MKQTPGSCILPLWLQSRGADPLFRTSTCGWDVLSTAWVASLSLDAPAEKAHLLDGNMGCSWDTDKYWKRSFTSITKVLIPVFLYSIRNNLSIFLLPNLAVSVFTPRSTWAMLEVVDQAPLQSRTGLRWSSYILVCCDVWTSGWLQD